MMGVSSLMFLLASLPLSCDIIALIWPILTVELLNRISEDRTQPERELREQHGSLAGYIGYKWEL